jgi:hypothetical protein
MNELCPWSSLLDPGRRNLSAEPSVSLWKMHGRSARWVAAGWTLATVVALAAVIVLIEASGPDRECVHLWNAPDNAAVRVRVAEEGYRSAALTAYNAGGEAGRVCYLTLLKDTRKTGDTFVIWPDNLFENGALHDYAGPFSEDEGYEGHRLSRDPTLVVTGKGRLAES